MNRSELVKDANSLVKDIVSRFDGSDNKTHEDLYAAIEDTLVWDDDIIAVIAAFGTVDLVRDYAFELLLDEVSQLVDIKD